MHLVLYKLVVAVEPKAFQSIPVECSAPGTGNPKQLFMNDGAKLLVGADDQGHDTAVEDELHHLLLIIGGVQVGHDYWLQNRLVRNVVSGKTHQSSSCLT